MYMYKQIKMNENQFVVIRVYQPSDEAECCKLIQEGVMSTVKPAFFTALTREVTFQIIIAMAAVMFIFIGLSVTICILAIPSSITIIFICVYTAHLKRSLAMVEEAMNIPKNFLSSKYTCFWVAELYESFCVNKLLPLKYSIFKEKDLEYRLQDYKTWKKKIIGVVGINRCNITYKSAWLRRMTVSNNYQRKGIATALLNEAIEFCQNKGYESIELVTSEFHNGARQLYLQKGFKLRQLYHKPILGTLVQVLMYQFTFAISCPNRF